MSDAEGNAEGKGIDRRTALGLLGALGVGAGLSQVIAATPAEATTLQDLIDAAPSGGAVELTAASTTTITASLTISKPLTLFSHGQATIAMTGSAPAIVISSSNVTLRNLKITSSADSGIVASGSGNLSGITIRNCAIVGHNSPISGKFGIDLSAVSDSLLDHVDVSYFATGIRVRTGSGGGSLATRNGFLSCNVVSCTTGVSVSATYCSDNRFVGCRFNSCSTYGISIVDARHTVVENCVMDSNGTGIYINATSSGAANYNVVNATKFIGNTTDWVIDSSNVASTSIVNVIAPSTYTTTDNGSATINGVLGGFNASATTLGSVTKKIRLYDPQGYSLGYLPLYSSIS